MNAGNSDTELLLLRRRAGRYVPFGSLRHPGGEDAEFFRIGDRSFLAVASIRSGSGPYEYTTTSTIHEWTRRRVPPVPVRSRPTPRSSGSTGRSATAISSGSPRDWTCRTWRPQPRLDGLRVGRHSFVEFQVDPVALGLQLAPVRGRRTVLRRPRRPPRPSLLYRWDGQRLVAHQELLRAPAGHSRTFDRRRHYLAGGRDYPQPRACCAGTDDRFVPDQRLRGPRRAGAQRRRERDRLFVIRVNFITGHPTDPEPALNSQVYKWRDGRSSACSRVPDVRRDRRRGRRGWRLGRVRRCRTRCLPTSFRHRDGRLSVLSEPTR